MGFRDLSFDWVFWVEILCTYILGVRFWVFWVFVIGVLVGCLGWSFYVQIREIFNFSGILRLGFDWVHFGGVYMYT